MLFNTYSFIAFVLITWVSYYVFPRAQVPVLVAASLVFYAWEMPVLVILLLTAILIYATSSYLVIYGRPDRRALVTMIGVTLALAVLVFFKYGRLIASTLLQSGSPLATLVLGIPLPVGISFYTFHGISLMVDALRSERVPEFRYVVHPSPWQHLLRVTLFISFFPQLVSGPILKAHDFIPQIRPKTTRDICWERCFNQLVAGYFLKMVVADNLKDYTYWIEYPYFEKHATVTLVTMLYGYSMQIIADFAGYSLIAMGLAGLFGYDVKANFNFPYISRTFSEFWTRWHISLSTFLKEYLYIPMGGNRQGRWRTYRNLLVTMLLGGLWHGAAWSYAAWGACHGLALAVERFFRDRITLPSMRLMGVVQGCLVFATVTFAWLFFKLPSFSHVVLFVRTLVRNTGVAADATCIFMILFYSLPVVGYHLAYLAAGTRVGTRVESLKWVARGIMLFLLISNSGSRSAFIYFQF